MAKPVWVAIAVLLAILAAGGGFGIARATSEDLVEARLVGEKVGAAEGTARGSERGFARGLKAGRRVGYRKAYRAAYKAQLAQGAGPQVTARPSQPSAQESPAQERARNCGAPLFADDYCPTDEEIAQENKAESLCGPGRYAEAKRQGIACFPPGDPRNP